ncbi:MAG: BatD family protein [Bacteriovoracaceae bacterium]|nr:BatD family protein [Bacteriovoracaceae bacterium]
MLKYILFTLFICGQVFANSVEVVIDPKEPLVNENFRVFFEIKTQDGTDPIINFDPLGLDVISRNETGIKTKTTYINGKLTTERSLTVVYEMLAKRAGSAFLRNINVEVNGNKIKHKTVRINILKTPRRARDILVRAEVSKEEAFVGESIIVRYYLYNRAPVSSTDIKKFPKLDKFLKRYHQEKMTGERASIDGDIYTRRVIYTAQLFATKPGDYKIDPITLGVQYSTRGSNPFDKFGLGSRYGSLRKLTVSSEPVDIKVKALPVDNVPASFTGLVGPHDFNLELNKDKFVVNEPIELKLVVSGPGALELFEAPRIFNKASIEEFEKNADLKVSQNFQGSKTILYTYLGREAEVIENKTIPFSYFDPESMSFKTKEVDLGRIVIAGTSNIRKNKTNTPNNVEQPKSEAPSVTVDELEILKPVYRLGNTYTYNAIKIMLALLLLVLAYSLYVFRDKLRGLNRPKDELLSVIAKDGVNYSRLHKLIERIGGNGRDMEEIVTNSNLSSSTKKSLISLINKCEKSYQESGKREKFKVDKKVLKEVSAYGIKG